ncbi:chemotaxis protein [Desulfovibrio litoralis]|uniref:Two-component system, chemotaxis family, response regulator CheV n=1 Tax=Desulfovibrio litoralis DSM 11393 TaxID=1121455 RepID=A0A1M7RRM4_9BACT|nr:chemotaxis protein [Desulfovibrio litoralis]SHN48840.1 two-component system, chemotaxis family, response regulator CheV [Desulfovibrio litoralis DSM 11393]
MSQTNILLQTGTNELEVVEFYIDEEGYRGHYGVNVAKVLEIIRMQQVTAIPQMRHPSVMGAFPHRDGRVVPLVDLAIYLGKKRIEKEPCKIIVTEFNQVITAFMVSGVNRIHRISWQEVEAPGAFLQHTSGSSITGVLRLEGRVVFLLDMESIVGDLDPKLAIRFDNIAQATKDSNRTFTVLHCDDSNNVRSLVKKLMENSGSFKVIQVNNGQDAWDKLTQWEREIAESGEPITNYVQAVITDIEMPKMDGLTLCRKIKETPSLRVLPVALFSSLITDKLEHKGETVGADAQFAKPDLQELSAKIIDLINKGSSEKAPIPIQE